MSKVKLKDICIALSDGLHAAPEFNEHGEYLFVNATNLEDGYIVDKGDGKRADYGEYLKYKIELDSNTILYSIDGTIGNTAMYHGEKCILGKGACYIRLNQSAQVDYIYYLLKSDLFNSYIKQMATGSTIHHISLETMRDFPFFLPEFEIQKQIAKIPSLIDKKIALNKRINAELEAMAKTLYDYWFVQFDFPDENDKPYRTSGGAMEYNEQLKREIPKGWSVGQLSDVVNITMGQSPAGDSYNEHGIGMAFFQGSTDFGVDYPSTRVYTTMPSRIAQQGDVLLSVRAPVGTMNTAYEKCCIGRGLAALRSKTNANTYAHCLMANLRPYFDVLNGNGTTFGSLTKDTLYEVVTLIPSDDMVKTFEQKVAHFAEKRFNNEKQTRELTRLRDWLLPMLMNGQATVSDVKEVASKVVEIPKNNDERFSLWLQNQGIAARGELDKKTLTEIFNTMDDDDK